jgi:hypothetical protein
MIDKGKVEMEDGGPDVQSEKTPNEALVGVGEEQRAAAPGSPEGEKGGNIYTYLEVANKGKNVQSEKTPGEALVGVGEEQQAAAMDSRKKEEEGEIDNGEVDMADEGHNKGRVKQTPSETLVSLEEEQRAAVKGAPKGDVGGEIDNGEVEMADKGQNEERGKQTPGDTVSFEEEQRTAVKRAKRAEKKKRKNGRDQNADAVKGSGSSEVADVGGLPEQKGAPEAVHEPILVWREVAAESTDGRARPGFFVGDAVSEIATPGSPAAAVPVDGGPARAPLDGSGQARVKPKQADLKGATKWSSMTPSEVEAFFQDKPSAAEELRSLAKHLLEAGEIEYARFTAYLKEGEKEDLAGGIKRGEGLMTRLDAAAETVMLDLVERAVEESTDSETGWNFDNLGSTDLE